jgi:hypothetical protein
VLACFHIRAVLYALRRSAKIEIRRKTRDFQPNYGWGRGPPNSSHDSACSAREQITAFGLYCSLCGQAFAVSAVTPSLRGHPATPRPLKTPPISSSSRRRGSPILLSGIFFYKSFPRCEPSLAHRFTLFDCSLGKPTSRSKNTRWVREINAFVGEICFSRFG